MKIPFWTIALLLGLLVAVILLKASLYTVNETEQVILTQFGRPVGTAVTEAGLHFKLPFVQDVNRLDKRILEWDGDPNEIPTKDKLYIHVDTYARWRISDPLLYFQRLRTEQAAQSRLDDILDGETRNAIARYRLVEIIRTSNREPEADSTLADLNESLGGLDPIKVGRSQIADTIQKTAVSRLTDLGIELLDIRFKRINYNDVVQRDIYSRMQSERQQIADKFRSEGEGEAARIGGQKERELQQIESEAYRKVQNIRGDADAEAIKIYADAYSQSPAALEFYRFIKTMETYRKTLGGDTLLLLTTDSELFRMLKGLQPLATP